MGKLRMEICIISARGLPRSSSLFKRQWFAVGWIDPKSKYCTRIDSSGASNPTWKTKFSVPIDVGSSGFQEGLSLNIEVYSREPIFLREKLHGSASVMLKEFLGRQGEKSRPGTGETGSFQLRKRSSGEPRGFVDVSVRVLDEDAGPEINGGIGYPSCRSGINLAIEDGAVVAYPTRPHPPRGNHFTSGYTPSSYPYSQQQLSPLRPPSKTGDPRLPTPPPPPPPPSNTGFLPTLFPAPTRPPEGYVGMPASVHSSGGPGFAAGLGAGALAAGAVIFGDDFMSGSSFPAGLDGGTLIVSADNPF